MNPSTAIVYYTDLLIRLRNLLFLDVKATPQAKSLADKLLHGSSSRNQEWLKAAYALFFDIIEVRYPPAGIIQSLEGVTEIIRACFGYFDANEVEHDTDAEIMLFEAGSELSLSLAATKLIGGNSSPLKSLNLITHYLVRTRNHLLYAERRGEEGNRRWERLCLAGYRATRLGLLSSLATQRKAEETKPNFGIIDHQAISSARAVAVALQYADLSRIREEYPIIFKEEITKEAVLKASEHERFEHSIKPYTEWATVLLSGAGLLRTRRTEARRNGLPITRQRSQIEDRQKERLAALSEEQLLNLLKDVTEPEIDPQWRETITNEVAEEGASPHEFRLPPKPSDIRSLRAGLAARARLARPLGWRPVWIQSNLTQEGFALVIASLLRGRNIEELSERDLNVLGFILAQLLFGFKPLVLLKATLGPQRDTRKESQVLSYRAGKFHIRPQGHDDAPVFGSPDFKNAPPCLSGGHAFELPVPQPLRRILDKLVEHPSSDSTLLFEAFASKAGEPDIGAVNEYLKSTNLKRVLGEKVNAEKIGRTGAQHLVIYGELDELIAALIRGHIPRSLAAQAHYANLSVKAIHCKHIEACRKLIIRLLEVSRSQLISLGLKSLGRLFETEMAFSADSNQLRFGSPYVPKQEAASRFLRKLSEESDAAHDPYTGHNRFTAFVILSLKFLTSLRPIEIERLTPESILFSPDGREAYLVIASKINKHFKEWRTVIVPSPFADLLKRYNISAQRVRRKLYDDGLFEQDMLDSLGESFFFFATPRRVIPVTTQSLGRALRAGTDGLLGIEPYPWKTNSPRHFFATTALEAGVPRRLIDALMGHTTRGREPLNRFSLLHFQELRQAASLIAHEINNRLGIFSAH